MILMLPLTLTFKTEIYILGNGSEGKCNNRIENGNS